LIILLLRSLSSLTSLYTMVMVSFISPLRFNFMVNRIGFSFFLVMMMSM